MTWRFFLFLLMVASIPACSIPSFALSPADAVRQMPQRDGATANPLADYPVNGGRTIVVYESTTPATPESPAMRLFGYVLTVQNGWQWNTLEGSGMGRAAPLDSTAILDFQSHVNIGGTRLEIKEPITIVFGEALHPDVASVEVTFGNAIVVIERVRDGVFAVTTPRETTICAVTALDANGAVLRRFDFLHPDLTCQSQVFTPDS